MRYNEFVEVNEGFQSSVNLEYDLNKIEKIEGYIPTEQSVKILGMLLRSYYYNSDPQARAVVLIGPYGRGKSHLLLVLSALTSLDCQMDSLGEKERAREIQKALCAKIGRVNPEIGALHVVQILLHIQISFPRQKFLPPSFLRYLWEG